jgi:hypothetical protein
MSNMIDSKPVPIVVDPERTSVDIVYPDVRVEMQCGELNGAIRQLVGESQGCQVDDDCVVLLTPDDFPYFKGCLFVVNKDKQDKVLAFENKSFACDIASRCRTPPEWNRAPTICNNNICAFRLVQMPPPPLDVLTERTLKSISESLSEEGDEVGN